MRANESQRRRRARTWRHVVGRCFAIAGVSWVLLASAAVARDAPVFLIEKIHVDTERLSPEIILSESLLREGREYSEHDLREAVHRIHRLPFVLLAEFSLEKGSERGRYELNIKIYETRRWFFQVGGTWQTDEQISRIDPRLGTDLDGRIGETGDDFRSLVGRRFAVGKRGLLFATFGGEDGAFSLGYQQFNLFDRNILLSLSVGGIEEIGTVAVGDSSWGARAQLGIPIRGNHALRILAGYSEFERLFFFGSDIGSSEREAEIVWVFNSLDDPVMPRDGKLFEAGLTWSDVEDTRFLFEDGEFSLEPFAETRTGALLSASRYWPVAVRQSVSLGLRAFVNEDEASSRQWEGEIDLGHQVFLKRRQEVGNWGELRLETRALWLRQDIDPTTLGFGFAERIDSWSVGTGLVYRNGWGLYRFRLEYVDRELR